jgi:hypothetical protein
VTGSSPVTGSIGGVVRPDEKWKERAFKEQKDAMHLLHLLGYTYEMNRILAGVILVLLAYTFLGAKVTLALMMCHVVCLLVYDGWKGKL